jgi:transposase
MRLSDHDLLQLTEEELLELPEGVLRRLSVKLLYDLKEARERLRQTSRNSSRPPSSDLPWDKAGINDEDQHPQQGADEFAGVDDHTLDSEEASKTEPEEKHRTRRTRHSKPRSRKMKQAIDGKLANNLGHPATGVNKRSR